MSSYKITVTVERNGRTYEGTATITGRGPTATVAVSSPYGSQQTQAGNSGAEATAERLLGEIVGFHTGELRFR